MPHFTIVLISYINLLNISWKIKYLFLRTMEPLNGQNNRGLEIASTMKSKVGKQKFKTCLFIETRKHASKRR